MKAKSDVHQVIHIHGTKFGKLLSSFLEERTNFVAFFDLFEKF